MKLPRTSVWPGIAVAVLCEVSAIVLLQTRPEAYTGSLGTWYYLSALVGVLPAVTLASAFVTDRHWMLRILLFMGLAVFWSSTPETAFLPVRYLLHCALVAQTCTQLPSWWKIPLTAAVVGELLLVQYVIPGMTADPPDWTETAVAVAAMLAVGVLLHREQTSGHRIASMADRNDKLHASVLQLTSANTEFLEQAAQAGEESAVSERNRITRDLHDVVGQTLTNIIMMMDAALHRKAHEPEETVKLLKWIRKQAQTGLEETRGVLYELRALRPGALRGLKALKKLVETFGGLSRIRTRVEWGNLPWTFDPEQEKAVYHLVQGSLSNAFRHGLATRIDVHFQLDGGVLGIMIRDNGRGGPDGALGLGQRGMEERLARWNGTVTFQSEPFGYVVTATLPLKEDETGPREDPHR